jgi:hypothetical protein
MRQFVQAVKSAVAVRAAVIVAVRGAAHALLMV